MRSTQLHSRLRVGMALLAGGIGMAARIPAAAQPVYSAPLPVREDPGDALSRNLRTLADSPRSLSALTGAAKAALDLGDAQAAATFYARAEEVAPRDGHVKAGLGAAFVAMEQPQPALRFFEEARTLGVAEAEFAADRGLAYDLMGNPLQAQRDYQLAMRSNDGDEVRRRMALSKAISGDRAGALAVIDDQLRRQDRAAWRVRAFVLALTGDASEATDAVRAVMPAQAAAMEPFLARLPSLRPADRAAAVHFGHFPDGPVQVAEAAPRQYASAANVRPVITAPASTSRVTQARREPVPTQVPTPARRSSGYAESGPSWSEQRDMLRGSGPSSRRETSKPAESRTQSAGNDQPTRLARVETRVPASAQVASDRSVSVPSKPVLSQRSDLAQQAAVSSSRSAGSRTAQPGEAAAVPAQPATTVSAPVQRAETAMATKPVQGPPAGAGGAVAAAVGTPPPGSTAAVPHSGSNGEASAEGSAVAMVTPPASAVSGELSPPAAAAPSGLADIAATIRALPAEERDAPAANQRPVKLADATKPKPKPEAKKAEPTPPETAKKGGDIKKAKKEAVADDKPAARHWVQLASASDKLALSEYRRLKARAPKLLSDTTGWKASFRSTNRVLVGPFKSEKDAQALVNALAKSNIDAVPWTSAEGQEIEKLAAK